MNNQITVTQRPTFRGASLMMDIILDDEIHASMLTSSDEVVAILQDLRSMGKSPNLEITLPYIPHPFDGYGELIPITKKTKAQLNSKSLLDTSQCMVVSSGEAFTVNLDRYRPSEDGLTFLSDVSEPDLIREVLCGSKLNILCGSTILANHHLAFLMEANIPFEIKSDFWPGNQYSVII